MSGGLPLADPQFWIVSSAALLALLLALRRILRRKKAGGAGALPCASCPKAGAGPGP
jgi:hypothetical protein